MFLQISRRNKIYKIKDINFVFWKRLICTRKENNIHKYEGTIPNKTRQKTNQNSQKSKK